MAVVRLHKICSQIKYLVFADIHQISIVVLETTWRQSLATMEQNDDLLQRAVNSLDENQCQIYNIITYHVEQTILNRHPPPPSDDRHCRGRYRQNTPVRNPGQKCRVLQSACHAH